MTGSAIGTRRQGVQTEERSHALSLYVTAVATIGGALVLHSVAATARMAHPLVWVAIVAPAILVGTFRLNIHSISASISVSDTFWILTALLFGPGPAAVAVAADSLVMSWRRHHEWEHIAFNAAAPAASIWVGAHVFFFVARVPPLLQIPAPITSLILPLLLLSLVDFLCNSALMAIAIGLEARRSPFDVWRRHFLWLSVSYLPAASVAFCLILMWQQASLGAAVMVLPLLAVFHFTLRASFGRLEDAQRHLRDVDRLYLSTIETLAMAIDAKDDVTHSHVRRVQAYAVGLARALGVDDEPSIKALEAAALLHDTGKLAVPQHILNKPGKLTESEFEQMKLHVDVGADILSLVAFPYPVVPIVRCHHENWDGSGYPRGVAGDDIPLGARILSVVDCFDALTSDRPYRRRMTEEAAFEILRERRGRMYDPVVVDTFIAVLRDITVAHVDTPRHREVLSRIAEPRSDSREKLDVATPPPATASSDVLAVVSLARLASGDGSVADVLALSSNLVRDIVPNATGAWYLTDPGRDRLTVAGAFGPAASALAGVSVGVGQRLTGWVAASRQSIVNSDAALDLDDRGDADAPLRTCMSVPLLMGESLVGVLSLYATLTDAFDEDRGRVIEMIAPHIAGAIHAAARTSPVSKPVTRELRLVSTR